MDLTHLYRILYPGAMKYKFFSAAPGTISKIDYTFSHKVSPKNYKKTGIVSCMS
jgi:hypothetical protein